MQAALYKRSHRLARPEATAAATRAAGRRRRPPRSSARATRSACASVSLRSARASKATTRHSTAARHSTEASRARRPRRRDPARLRRARGRARPRHCPRLSSASSPVRARGAIRSRGARAAGGDALACAKGRKNPRSVRPRRVEQMRLACWRGGTVSAVSHRRGLHVRLPSFLPFARVNHAPPAIGKVVSARLLDHRRRTARRALRPRARHWRLTTLRGDALRVGHFGRPPGEQSTWELATWLDSHLK